MCVNRWPLVLGLPLLQAHGFVSSRLWTYGRYKKYSITRYLTLFKAALHLGASSGGGMFIHEDALSPWPQNWFGRASVTVAACQWRKVHARDVKLEALQWWGQSFVWSGVLCTLVGGHSKSTRLQLNRWLSSMPLNPELSQPSGTPGVFLFYPYVESWRLYLSGAISKFW